MEILHSQVQAYFQANASRYGLDAALVQVNYVLNWGGFVNSSFTVSDGRCRFHLKLAGETQHIQRLQRWNELRRPLEERYHAPRLLEWIEIPGTSYAGLFFEQVLGRMLGEDDLVTYLPALLDNLNRLSADQELAERLEGPDKSVSLADFYVETYIHRFEGDLDSIRVAPPEFLDAWVLDWMEEETRRLEEIIRANADFSPLAVSPVHGDLWANNVLLTQDGQWYLLDWDDLSLGDPACDYVLLLWPLLRQGWEAVWAKHPLPGAGPDFTRRIPLYMRAHMLDEIIDSVADYVEAEAVPEHRETVRRAKEAVHRRALARYRSLYPESFVES